MGKKSKRRNCIQCSRPHATHDGLCGLCYVVTKARTVPSSMRAVTLERPVPAINPIERQSLQENPYVAQTAMPGILAGVAKTADTDTGRAPIVRDYIGRKHGSGRERKVTRLVSLKPNGTLVRRGEASRVSGLDDKPEQIPNYEEPISDSRKEYTLESTGQTVIAVRPNGRKTRVAGHKEPSKWFSAPIYDVYVKQDIRRYCQANGLELKERDYNGYTVLSCKDRSAFTRKGIMPK